MGFRLFPTTGGITLARPLLSLPGQGDARELHFDGEGFDMVAHRRCEAFCGLLESGLVSADERVAFLRANVVDAR